MKWTVLSIAAMGVATYGVILLAQLQHESREGHPEPSEPAVSAAAAFTDPEPATVLQARVSEPAEEELANEPLWAGDAWTAGVAAFEQRDDELAVEALRAAVAEREDSSYRHYLLGLALRRIGAVEDAVVELERSLELSPGATKTWAALARCELDRSETAAARTAVDAALELDLEDADAWHLLGRVELDEGALDGASAAFARALDHDPGHAWAANNLGYVCILQGRFEEALAPLKLAVASGVVEPVFFNNLGIALERAGHPELAALSFAHAVVLGHAPAAKSMQRVEDALDSRGRTFAAADSVEFVDASELVARVEQAGLVAAVDAEPSTEREAGLVAANDDPESDQ